MALAEDGQRYVICLGYFDVPMIEMLVGYFIQHIPAKWKVLVISLPKLTLELQGKTCRILVPFLLLVIGRPAQNGSC